jgi:hypothetical protein
VLEGEISMANTVLKDLSNRLNKSNGSTPFTLSEKERLELHSTLNTHLDTIAADHSSSHQNNHSSRPSETIKE